jgi:hypothetical protein
MILVRNWEKRIKLCETEDPSRASNLIDSGLGLRRCKPLLGTLIGHVTPGRRTIPAATFAHRVRGVPELSALPLLPQIAVRLNRNRKEDFAFYTGALEDHRVLTYFS